RCVYRNVYAARQVYRQIRDDPLVAIFRNLHDPVARPHSTASQSGGGAADVAGQFAPGTRNIPAVGFDANRGPFAAAPYAGLKQGDDCVSQDSPLISAARAQTRSKIVAMPCPTPMHMVARPSVAFLSIIL